jgi:ABC-2 type transport system ATP-binding protein
MSVSGAAVVVDGLVKRYGAVTAVDSVSFDVQRGEVIALLGPNGAGKTTTIEILEGYREPTSGRVSVLGFNPAREGARLKPRVGVMLQESGMYLAITPREALRLWSRFYARPRDPEDLLHLVGLDDVAGTRYRRLSGGQKRRLSLALALVGSPDLVFLDEPTAGLDPQARRAAWDIVRALKDAGVTVILATHYLDEAERLADRVAIMRDGRLAANGELRSLLPKDESVRVRTEEQVPNEYFAAIPTVRRVRRDRDDAAILETACPRETVADLAARLRDASVTAREISVGRSSLEDLFFDLTDADGPA